MRSGGFAGIAAVAVLLAIAPSAFAETYCKPAAGESKVDLDGQKRVIDGDGDGTKRRDIGAFERPKA